ncbi:MAG TPA: ATP-binding protein [Myxococcota bacterium]|nr:ATP-binding protein [Myxococcota bacterium]HRY97263.1 ATP-binding protein [Myxococcota bacterium]HSA22162.1 ATP-binding protein [Myxococcota bacterium]
MAQDDSRATDSTGWILGLTRDPALARSLEGSLRERQLVCRTLASPTQAVASGGEASARLVLVELGAPHGCALEELTGLRAAWPSVPVVCLLAEAARTGAADALREGAALALPKPMTEQALEEVLRLALHLARLQRVRFPDPGLQAMVELQHGLASGVPVADLLDYLLQLMLRHLQADTGSLMLVEPDGEHLELVASHGLEERGAAGQRVRIGERVSGWVAEHDRPQLILGESSDDPRLAGQRRTQTPAVGLCFPMRGSQGVLGVVCLGRRDEARTFQPEEVELGLLLAGEVGRTLERRRAAERQMELERMALRCDKLVTLGEMAAGVAHEINNPLSFIAANLNSLRDFAGELLPVLKLLAGEDATRARGLERLGELDLEFMLEDLPRCVKETQEGLARVLRIVQDLKSLSREDRETKELTSVNQVVEGALSIVWNQIKHKARLEKELGKVPSIPCFPSQLGQALLNLLSNAAQAVEAGGRIQVRTGVRDDAIFIEVEDNGCGMPPEVQRRMFEPFFTTKPRGVGTGLGMAVVRRTMERHDGRVEMRSAPGEGTLFRLWLPLPRVECGMAGEG